MIREETKWSNLCDFYFFILRHCLSGWAFPYVEMDEEDITKALRQKEPKL